MPRSSIPFRAPREKQPGRSGPPSVVPEVVAEARRLLEETALARRAIARQLGVDPTTLRDWQRRGGWVRPPDAPGVLPGPLPNGRARPSRYRTLKGRPYGADAVGMVRNLVTGTLLSCLKIARQAGVSPDRVSIWSRKHGWQRPPVTVGSKRFAASGRTGPLATEGDRRGRPYAPEVKREARALWELTRLPTSLIGARLGAHPGTVARWASEGSWERPRERAGRAQLAGFFGTLRQRGLN